MDTDGYTGCKLLTKELLRAGHRKIYCVRGPEIYPNARDRFQGFVDAMRESGIEVDGSYPYVFNGHFTIEGGIQAVDYLFSFTEQPTAILSESNMSTVGIMQRLLDYHIRVPEDISLAGHDQIENMQLFATCPCSAVYDLQAIAQCVGTAILERIQDPSLDMRHYVFEPSLQHGNSIAPPSSTLSEKLRNVALARNVHL
ncbi:transcriptional regulator LacI family [Oscillibacter sp. CAG:155]|nr:transcriptional regulator LacI family [Oscillibacter sp. CAG:155]